MTFLRPRLIVVLLLATVATYGQTQRKKSVARPTPQKAPVTQPTPNATPTPLPSTTPQAPVPLVIVNGQTVTTADIDPSARAAAESVSENIQEARNRVLTLQINTILLAVEAGKRGTTPQQLYDANVTRRIVEPTSAEIDAFIQENGSQMDQSDPAALRKQVAGFLRGERETKLSEEFVNRLKTTNSMVPGVSINTSNLSPSAILATIGGQPVTAGPVLERLKPIIYKLRLNAYQVERQAAERTLDDLLLLADASRRNVGPEEIVRTEVTEKMHQPTEAEVAKFYEENKSQISGTLDTVRNQLVSYLQDEEQKRLERALSEKLRKGADIRWLISEPEAPVQLISTDDDPAQGDPKSAATIVEFTDFECPACAAMQPILEEVLKSYAGKIRFVVRDFPLARHPFARKAAEAANAANAQGKFFEYAALLFQRQNALDIASLKKYASELGLNRTKFDAALDNGTYAAEVRHDVQDGESYGIEATPTIFVNGVMLNNLSAEGLRAAIDRALSSATSPRPAN